MGIFEEKTLKEKQKEEKIKKKEERKKSKTKKIKGKKIMIHAVVPYDLDFNNWIEDYAKGNFSSFANKPLTFCSSYKEAEEYCEQYFFMYNYHHFKLWCNCHQGEDVNSADSWVDYVGKVLAIDDDPNRQFLKICSFSYPASEVASLLRLSLNSLPVGLDTEEPEIISEIVIESISSRSPLPDNYLQVFNGMKEYYLDYEQRTNKKESDYLVSRIIKDSLDVYLNKIEEIENEEKGNDSSCVN